MLCWFGLVIFIIFSYYVEVNVVYYYNITIAIILCALLLYLYIKSTFRVLLALIILLPLHQLIMSSLAVFTSVSPEMFRLIAGWKEFVITISFSLCIINILCRGKDITWTVSDGLGLIYLMIIIFTMFLPIYIYPDAPELIKKLYSLRDAAFFMVLYYLGRFARIGDREAGIILWALLWVGFIASLVGFLERFLLPEEIYIQIGFVQYSHLLGLEFIGEGGLPENLYVTVAGESVRRLASFFLTSQGFAQTMIVIFPAVIYLTSVSNSVWRARLKWVLFIVLIAQILTISRMPIIAVIVGLLVSGRLLKDRFVFRIGLVLFTMMSILGIISGVLSTSETSFAGHLTALKEGIEGITESPFLGHGPATSGIVSVRDLGGGKGLSIGGPEGQYTALGVQFGIPALLLNIAFLGSIIIESLRGLRGQFDWRPRGICLIAGVAGIGVMLNSITTTTYGLLSLSYIYFLIAGLSIQKSIEARRKKACGILRKKLSRQDKDIES